MYINSIAIENFRTFRKTEVAFVRPDADFKALDFPKPQFPNINLLLGNNGMGKTTLLKAIALAALGPAVGDSGIYPYRLIRREPKAGAKSVEFASIEATFTPHEQDHAEGIGQIESSVKVQKKGDLESLRWDHGDEKRWHPIFSSESDAFFFVGFGATRRVEKKQQVDFGSRRSSSFIRAQRVQSLFEDAYSLIPLNSWLPDYALKNPGRFKQVQTLINKLSGKGHYEFTDEMEDGEYLFRKNGLSVPFPAMSDGYRSYFGWVCDLLYHVCMTCPPGNKLIDNRGIVMVDEIDLHLHPKWQMTVLPTLAKELPNIQFIVTSHSPLIVGTLEWMNIIVMSSGPGQSSKAERVEWAVHGLDADQVLLTDYFGLESTRAPGMKRNLKELTLKAGEGDTEAAKQLLAQMSRGMENGK